MGCLISTFKNNDSNIKIDDCSPSGSAYDYFRAQERTIVSLDRKNNIIFSDRDSV